MTSHGDPQTSLLRMRAVAAGLEERRMLERYRKLDAGGAQVSTRQRAWRDYEAARAHEARAMAALFAAGCAC